MVTFNRTDLEFILTQILQAEAGQPPVNPHLAFGLREVSGTDNNAVPGQDTFGSADQVFPTATTQYFRTVTVNVDGTIFDPNPGVAGDTMTTTYASTDPSGIVVDSAPRTISNLISDISADNPAALQAAQTFSGQLGDGYTVLSSNPGGLLLDPGPDGVFGTADDPAVPDPVNLFIGNITPDSGLSAPFNSWMTFFGQFFDHGLDLITKGGSGTVFIPLAPDDPLILVGPDGIAGTGDEVDPSQAFMVLTRATNEQVLPGADGVLGTSDDIHRNINTTTPFVDQNQTYTSHPSHQVFLREYMVGSDGQLHSSGKLLQHAQGPDGVLGTADDNTGMATWADVKANALKLGIVLSDYNVGDVPLLATDAYGNFIPGANGFAQVVVRHADGSTTLVEGTAAGLDLTHPDPADPAASVVFTGHAFINDTAFFAVPFDQQTGALLTADADTVAGNVPEPGSYDNELLDAHYIAGDGRANENIALTAVHTIFHDEHNRLVEQMKELVRGELAKGDVSFALELGAAGGGPVGRHPGQRMERRPAVPDRQARHRDPVPAPGVRGVRAQDRADHPPVRQHRHPPRPGDRVGVRQRGVPLRPLDAGRERADVPAQRGRHAGDRSRRPAGRHRCRPDPGVHQPACVRGRRRRGCGGDRAGHHAPDRL